MDFWFSWTAAAGSSVVYSKRNFKIINININLLIIVIQIWRFIIEGSRKDIEYESNTDPDFKFHQQSGKY